MLIRLSTLICFCKKLFISLYRSFSKEGIIHLDGLLQRQPSNKHQHHGGAGHRSSSMAIGFPATSSQGPPQKGWLRVGLKGLDSFYNLTTKKINYSTQQFYCSFYLQSNFNAPKSCYCTLPTPTTRSHILFILSPVTGVCFWLIVVCKMINHWPPKATMFLYSNSFHHPICHPKGLNRVPPPHAPRPTRLRSHIPHTTSGNYQLIVEYSCLIGSHLRPRPHLPLYYLMGLVLVP